MWSMKNKNLLFLFLCVMIFTLTGCGQKLYEPQLPENYTLFNDFGFQSKQVEEDGCSAFEYNGRTYYFYSYCRNLYEDEVNKSLGRLVFGGEEDSYVIVSLSYDDSDDYLVNLYEGPELMAPPNEVYRAIDTRDKDIDAPSFIDAPQYSEEEKCGDRMAQYWLNGKE